MTIRSIALAGVATLALSVPALAARHAASDPAADAREAQITAQLNQQQLAQPGATPSVNESAMAANDNDTMQSGNQMQMSANTSSPMPDKTSANSSAAPQSEAGKMASEAGNEIDQATGLKTPVTKGEMATATSITVVAPDTLKTAELKNPEGQALGEVKSVRLADDGEVAGIVAEVGGFLGVGEREVSLDTKGLSYLKSRNIIIANYTREQLAKMPAMKQQ